MRKSYKALLATLLSMGLLLMVVGTASAHAKVDSATPGIGSTITTVPTTVTVHALENINPDPKVSNLFVYGPAGDLISQGNAKVPLSNPQEMSVAIKASGNGVYVVRWITKSALDGDPDEGAFIFTVKPATVAPTPAPAQTPPSTSSTGGSSSPVLPVTIASIIALVVGLGAGFGFGRSRTNAASAAIGANETQADPEKASTPKP